MNGKIGLLDRAMKAGPVTGGVSGLCYAAAYTVYFIKNRDLSDLAQVFFGVGFAATAYGVGRGLKKQSDIIVASEAEKRLDPNTAMAPSSIVPAIHREIQAQKLDATVNRRETK